MNGELDSVKSLLSHWQVTQLVNISGGFQDPLSSDPDCWPFTLRLSPCANPVYSQLSSSPAWPHRGGKCDSFLQCHLSPHPLE